MFTRQPTGLCCAVLRQLAEDGWRRVIAPLTRGEVLLRDYLVHPSVRLAPDVLSRAAFAPTKLVALLPQYDEWARTPPAVGRGGLLSYWSWASLVRWTHAHAVPLYDVARWSADGLEVLPMLLDAGWRRDREAGELLVHPNAEHLVHASYAERHSSAAIN